MLLESNDKLEKAKEFIGWKSKDGKLEVIGVHSTNKNEAIKYKVTCTECSKDKELFPDGYFVSTKYNLNADKKPCGCSVYKWEDWQYLIIIKRLGAGRFIVHGFAEEFNGQDTKLDLECLKDGNRWQSTSITSVINGKSGCPECKNSGTAKRCKLDNAIAMDNCSLICQEMGYTVIGFVNGYKNAKSRFEYICPKHGRQNVKYSDFFYKGSRCNYCAKDRVAALYRLPEDVALGRCVFICREMNYEPQWFPDGYKTQKSYFEYVCPVHGKQSISYSNFVHNGNRCMGCSKDRHRELRNGNGYFPERKDETDFLYVLNFNDKFIKVGRSFDVNERIKDLRIPSMSGIRNIKKLRIFTATHQEIYDYEQELHKELRERNFQYPVSWSTECFENDSLYILNKLLDNCEFQEVDLHSKY